MDAAKRNGLVERHLPLVRRLAGKAFRRLRKVEFADLVSDGAIGLMRAIEAYDESAGVRFETYASTRIYGAMLDGVRERDWLSRLDRKKQSLGEHVATLGSIGDQDFAGHDGVDSRRIDREHVKAVVMKGLSFAEQAVIDMHYFEDMSLRECGEAIGVSESRAFQLRAQALELLRDRLAGREELLL